LADLAPGFFNVTLVTPAGVREEYNVRHLRAPGVEGDFGVLTGHRPFMTALRVGSIHLNTDAGPQTWATTGGYVEVLPDRVTILAETAERAEKIDLSRAEAAHQRAVKRLTDPAPETDIARAQAALARALNRIKIAREAGRE
jgi:F-type H+-transporting ATPase subunit epsilon